MRPTRSDVVASVREFAPAKINLTLEVAGRRDDGFHELASLVAFADVGDGVTLEPGAHPGVRVSGPFAGSLAGPNILDRALLLLQERAPRLALGAVHLDKRLPVAAGIGGGSADAGALLRAVRRANGAASDGVDWLGIARTLGADVPVCFAGRSLWMTGTGEALSDIEGGLPPLSAVLVNPLAEVPPDKTARVFAALAAKSVPPGYVPLDAPRLSDHASLLGFLRARGNDLACAAERVVPETGAALAALGAFPSCAYAGVSGAGPTCFGIFADATAAGAACEAIGTRHPDWWAVAATLG